jgi:hypothetical protein
LLRDLEGLRAELTALEARVARQFQPVSPPAERAVRQPADQPAGE